MTTDTRFLIDLLELEKRPLKEVLDTLKGKSTRDIVVRRLEALDAEIKALGNPSDPPDPSDPADMPLFGRKKSAEGPRVEGLADEDPADMLLFGLSGAVLTDALVCQVVDSGLRFPDGKPGGWCHLLVAMPVIYLDCDLEGKAPEVFTSENLDAMPLVLSLLGNDCVLPLPVPVAVSAEW